MYLTGRTSAELVGNFAAFDRNLEHAVGFLELWQRLSTNEKVPARISRRSSGSLRCLSWLSPRFLPLVS